MNTIFENKTVITDEILTESSKQRYKIYRRKYRIFLLVMFFICILFVIAGLTRVYLYWFSVWTLLMAAFFFLMFSKGYIIRMKQDQRNMRGLYGESPQFIYTFSNDNILRATLHSNIDINYSQITKVLETTNLYILMIEKQGLILKKDSFTIGNSDDFKLFIENKCKCAVTYK
jgi:Ca2+/Na+ antiporter